MKHPAPHLGLVLCLLLLSASCAPYGRQAARQLAADHGFRPEVFHTELFDLKAWVRGATASDLHVYIEGDGKAWATRFTPSNDPTPEVPVAFELAARDPSPAVLYLARPCQYADADANRNCHPVFWTSARFCSQVVDAADAAIDQAKRETGAQRIHLIGYSGGGAVAVLAAARRSDVASIVTVGGNLNTALWTSLHHVSPLRNSLDPIDAAGAVAAIPQLHLVGAKDDIMPPEVARSFADAAHAPTVRIRIIPDADHRNGWEAVWPGAALELWRSASTGARP